MTGQTFVSVELGKMRLFSQLLPAYASKQDLPNTKPNEDGKDIRSVESPVQTRFENVKRYITKPTYMTANMRVYEKVDWTK